MKPSVTILAFIGCFYVPLLSLLALAWLESRVRANRAERVPIAEKLLRPAGESLRVKLEKLDEKMAESLAFAVLIPATALGVITFSSSSGMVTPTRVLVGLATCLGLFSFLAVRTFRVIEERRRCALGFHGERAVGEEINQLLSDGCRVFHDVPMEPYGNVDHVIVAPSGVYAVETKTRRKRKVSRGKREHVVVFDGKALHFPQGPDIDSPAQARQQADRMRVFLTSAVGEPVKVSPLLTIPGWWVENRVKEGVKVVNPKQIRGAVVGPTKLTPSLIGRICHQLNQKCRDVEI